MENVPRLVCFGISPNVSKFLGCLCSCSGKKPECLELADEGLRIRWTLLCVSSVDWCGHSGRHLCPSVGQREGEWGHSFHLPLPTFPSTSSFPCGWGLRPSMKPQLSSSHTGLSLQLQPPGSLPLQIWGNNSSLFLQAWGSYTTPC